MTVRISQRLIACSFIVSVVAVATLFGRIVVLAGLSVPASLGLLLGVAGWGTMVAACGVVLFHPKPETHFLGRFAFAKEPLFGEQVSARKRTLATGAVIACAALALFVACFFFTDTAREWYERDAF